MLRRLQKPVRPRCRSFRPLSKIAHDASELWQEWLDSSAPLYLLGRGPALASVYEGALLLHETAKASAVSMSCGQFRHGPVEAVSADFRAVVFGTPEPTRALDRSLADDLSRMGAKVRWVGPAEADSDHAPSLIQWPEVPSGACRDLRDCAVAVRGVSSCSVARHRSGRLSLCFRNYGCGVGLSAVSSQARRSMS